MRRRGPKPRARLPKEIVDTRVPVSPARPFCTYLHQPEFQSGARVVAPSQESVKAFHAAALKHDGRDNGKPGVRKDYGPHYYAAFVHDPEGYRLEAHHEGK